MKIKSIGRPECAAKVHFPNSKYAKLRAKQLTSIHNKHYKVYKCDFCTGFHLTTKTSMDQSIAFRTAR